MVRQPIDASGQPRASAILRCIAMTYGDCMMLGAVLSERRLDAFRAARWCARSSVHVVAAGVQTSGYVLPSMRGSQPRASASCAAPDALKTTLTLAQRPSIIGRVSLYSWAISLSSSDFSCEDTMLSTSHGRLPSARTAVTTIVNASVIANARSLRTAPTLTFFIPFLRRGVYAHA